MDRYKPQYLGKLLSVNDPEKVMQFMNNHYDEFNIIYSVCEDESENIDDIELIDSESVFGIRIYSEDDKLMDRLSNHAMADKVIIEGNKLIVK